ncbi:cytochrome P450 [Lophiostoma macrostomum CBS 122681]|uniref:Cytochrome P450 n=1 Tax=Lophiostoma macrostomum CBS 122681 TaxID=1314788 RepID=A0A6A6T649_9PLEO|nr:cytochrome P450 [Lophiostoma macrostomum CBS 122681]
MGMPMPEWSWVFGHLMVFRQCQNCYPSDAFAPVVMRKICADFYQTDMFYLDLWPFNTTMLIINDPEVAKQISSAKPPFPKPAMFGAVVDPIAGGPNLLTMNGPQWKEWRSVFNPAFSQSYLQDQVSVVVESTEVFCRKLRERQNAVFCLENLATRLTMDIIIKVALDDDLNYQNAPSSLADSLRRIVGWSNFGDPFLNYHPIRLFAIFYYGRKMNRYVRQALEERWKEVRREATSGQGRRSGSVISLALHNYFQQRQSVKTNVTELDGDFADFATRQMRLFLFAGHDTTTSVLVYTYHTLSDHPAVLRRLREEHNTVFGSLPGQAGARIKETPSIVNELPYTMAVLKETMRMYPPAGALRHGIPGEYLVDKNGARYPTEGCQISIQHNALHHHPHVWPRVGEFLPERWLVDANHELYPRDGAFRVFEHGPRNCIGQNLALIELRVVLALTVRSFDICPAYEEWDIYRPRSILERIGFAKRKPGFVDGDRAYQIEKGGGHPSEGYPCIVTCIGD